MHEITNIYLSTGEVSQILELSIGSIQKLTNQGILISIKTAGGHRRILKSSVLKYCHDHGYELSTKPRRGIFILHAENSNEQAELKYGHIDGVIYMDGVLKLIGLENIVGTIFIDANYKWIDMLYSHEFDDFQKHFRICIFNANKLNKESIITTHPNIFLYYGEICQALIEGYLMGQIEI